MKDIIRMNQLAGLITESQAKKMMQILNEEEENKSFENEEQAVDFLNQHKKEIFDKFDVKDGYGVSEKKFLNGKFEYRGPFMFHNVAGYDDSSIEFTLSPNEERKYPPFKQEEVEVGGKKFYLTTVQYY